MLSVQPKHILTPKEYPCVQSVYKDIFMIILKYEVCLM